MLSLCAHTRLLAKHVMPLSGKVGRSVRTSFDVRRGVVTNPTAMAWFGVQNLWISLRVQNLWTQCEGPEPQDPV